MPRTERGAGPGAGGQPHRLFFALWPDEVVRQGIHRAASQIAQAHRGGRQVSPQRYHLTLQFLGDIAAEDTDATVARSKLAADAVRCAPFELVFDHAGSFHDARVWWLGTSGPSDGLHALWNALESGLRDAGQRVKPSHGFSPHLTILRDVRTRLPATPIEPLHWRVRGFALVDSQPPSPYKVVDEWALHA